MPIIILLNDSKKHLDDISTKMRSIYDIEIHKDAFTDTKSILSNMNLNKLYILLNCDIKPYRYVVYTLAKKQEAAYCILTTEPLSTAKHDNPYILINNHLDIEKINEIFKNTLKCSTAHKKKLVNNNNYLSSVKTIINKVNDDYTNVIQAILKDCEHKLLRMLSINPIDVDEIEHTYRRIINNEI
ncbi:hypothetical protein P3W45_001053 [Vairimorpha bombi]|jgi:ribosomal protein S20